MLSGGPPRAFPFATLQAAVARAAQSDTGLTFIDAREEERAFPYAELYARARRAAGALRERGVRPGDRVALVLPTGEAFMDAFFGALLARAVPVPLYPPLRLGRMDEYHARTARMLEVSGARLVVSDARIGRLLGVALARARTPLADASELSRGPEHEEQGAPGDLALVQFSSGTTVDPKPVALTHANVLANCAAIDSFVPEGGPVRQAGVSWLPLYHDMGLIGCLLLGITHPGPLALLPPELFLAKPALWLRAISRHRATITVAPDFAYALALKRVRDEELAGVDLSTLRLALDGAEPVAPRVLRAFADRFARYGFDAAALRPVYGLSEASLAVTFSRHLRTLTRDGRELASVGTPVPGVDARVEDGHVLVRGPSVMRAYLGGPEVLRDGWLDTGDLGFIEDGELFISGREKDLVILRGRNHAPQEFEEALDGLEGARAGCVAAVGAVFEEHEELALLVERSGEVAADFAETVRARVLERTGIRPHAVHILEPGTLPRTSSGKLRRGEALRQLLDGSLRAPRPVNAVTMSAELVKSAAARALSRLRGDG